MTRCDYAETCTVHPGDRTHGYQETRMTSMTEPAIETCAEFAEFVTEALFAYADDNAVQLSAESFADAQLLTTDDGLVVRLAGGTELQLKIQRSR